MVSRLPAQKLPIFSDIHLAEDERPEDLYQRLMALVEDSLLHAKGLTHHGEHVPEDEELTPTLASIKPQLSQVLNFLLDEICASDDA